MMEEVEQTPLGSEGLYFMPHLRGSLVPHKHLGARGCFLGLRDIHRRGHLARGVFEGLALEYRIVVERMEKALGQTFSEISCFGGGSQNRVWVQIKADVLNRPLKVYRNRQNTGLGAAILAGLGSGLYRDWTDARQQVQHAVDLVEPDERRSREYDLLYRNTYTSIFKHKKEIDNLIEQQSTA